MSDRYQSILWGGSLLLLAACGDGSADKEAAVSDTGGEDATDATSTLCDRLSMPVRDFNPESSMLTQRHAPAGDFTVPLLDGTEWTLSEHWSGCESYIFLPHWLPVDEADGQSWWVNGIDGLIDKSPPNVHYFFVVAGDTDDPTLANTLADNIAENLIPLSDDDREWWTARLHVVAGPSDMLDGLVNMMFRGGIGTYGMAIDRFQKLRTLGSMAAVDAYDPALDWPWERRIYEAGYQPEYYNFEAKREARLESEDALIVEVLGGDVVAGFEDGTLVLPDNIHEYDTLEIDVIMECPNANGVEIGNCGPWDYLAHMWLWEDFETAGERKESEEDTSDEEVGTDDDTAAPDDGTEPGDGTTTGEGSSTDTAVADTEADGGSTDTDDDSTDADDTAADSADTASDDTGEAPEEPAEPEEEPEPPTGRWVEMARFITTYHRESRWVVDATHALAWLQEGGERTVRYEWAPSWNTQPTAVTTRFRFTKRGKNEVVRETADLFTGGSFNIAYNDREPMEVVVPNDATKVELVSIITGHGMDTQNCAEFCDHSHHFTVNGTEYSVVFDEPGNQSGCAETVGEGTVPNQAGTWWYGRGGWCPGREVEPHIMDVTEQVTPGETATIGYQAKLNGGALIDNAGNIRLSSWLVFHK